MKISIIITFYNLENYVSRNLNSLFDNFNIDGVTDQIEVICINDGSSDNTLQKLLEFQKQHSNMVVINNDNYGVSFSRNAGLKVASGEHILFADGDDYFHRIDCKKMILDLEKNNAQIFFFDYINKYEKYETISTENVRLNKFNFENHIWNKIFLKKILDENNLRFDTQIKMGEDMLFLFKYLNYTKEIKKIESLTYVYDRTRENSIMNNFKEAHLKELNFACKELQLFAKTKSSKEYSKGIEYVVIKNQLVRSIPKLLFYSLKNKKNPLIFITSQIININLDFQSIQKNDFLKNDYENYFEEKLGRSYFKRIEEFLSFNKFKLIKCLSLIFLHKIAFNKLNEKIKL